MIDHTVERNHNYRRIIIVRAIVVNDIMFAVLRLSCRVAPRHACKVQHEHYESDFDNHKFNLSSVSLR